MESPTSNQVAKDFQVTGVSRSGRVRKKSSKLLDFESPEEIEKRTRRQSTGRQPSRYPGRGRPSNAMRDLEPSDQEMGIFEEPNVSESEAPLLTTAAILNSDDEMDNLVQDLVDGVEAEATNQESPVRQSLYMREKVASANRRRPVKDARSPGGKDKEKVKQRYTAYSLWAREVRKKDLQDLDFSNVARKLGEMWANVSNREKNAWKRKAKMQATRAKSRDPSSPTIPTQMASNGSPNPTGSGVQQESSFQNRATTSRTKKLAADRQQSAASAAALESSTSQATRRINTRSGRTTQAVSETETLSQSSHQLETSAAAASPTSIEVIDAAAHLKLLGESLTVIGERLKKHNGHVALSGSLSVLLDSLLCSMGPLLCMTTQIPGLENKAQLSRNLATTLDNIAYVMPGL
ncbi:FACT complex subunit SSRP1 [Drosophila bipectinata]|uniref:FACT complex subunit SSRP1 n=1 Tax=Drosophila bipectinata TaxID=42026 RepID=UPI001C8ADC07|nr:FACT complex subunit SSRP1 [Drosophila bipectinata]